MSKNDTNSSKRSIWVVSEQILQFFNIKVPHLNSWKINYWIKGSLIIFGGLRELDIILNLNKISKQTQAIYENKFFYKRKIWK